MRTFIALLVGIVIGAAGFHAFYVGLPPADRCTWDHPLSDGARVVCRQLRAQGGYDAAARHALDRLIDDVGK